MYCLAKCPSAQEKAFQEVCEVIPTKGEITAEIVNKLTFLKACVKEAARYNVLVIIYNKKITPIKLTVMI